MDTHEIVLAVNFEQLKNGYRDFKNFDIVFESPTIQSSYIIWEKKINFIFVISTYKYSISPKS